MSSPATATTPETYFASGQIGNTTIGIDVAVDNESNPARMLISFQYQPQTDSAKNFIFGPNGVKDQLVAHTNKTATLDPATGRYAIPWTDVSRAGFHAWFKQLAEMGFDKNRLERLAHGMDNTKAAVVSPDAMRVKEGFGSMPKGSIIRIDSLQKIGDETWNRLKQLPGIFVIPPSNRPMPISGSWASNYYAAHHEHPSPAFISAVHVEQVSRILPAIAAQKAQMRADMGLDYPIYGPERFAIPGRDPETGRPYQLWPFQAEGVSSFIAKKRMVLMLGVGAGKTLLSLTAAQTLFRLGLIDRCIIIAPRRLQKQWADFLASYYGLHATLLSGGPAERKATYVRAAMSNTRYFIMKYDTPRLPDAQTHLAPLLTPRTLVIIDEVHHLKHADTKRYQAIQKLLDGVRWTGRGEAQFPQYVVDYRLFVTGTLAHDKPTDVYGPIQLLGLHVWNTEDEFQRLYFDRETVYLSRKDPRTGAPATKQRVVRMNPTRIADLQEVVASVGFTKTTEELNLQLPPLRKQSMTIEPTGYELKAYQIIKGEVDQIAQQAAAMNAALRAGNPGAVKQFMALQNNLLAIMSMERQFSCDPAAIVLSTSPSAVKIRQQTGDGNLLALSPGSKMQALLGWLGNFLEFKGTKVVVFCSFTRLFTVMAALFQTPPRSLDADELEDLMAVRAHSVFFHGELSDAQGNAVLDKFKKDPQARVLFSSDAGGEGVNDLQGAAQFVIHYDLPLGLGVITQREGRVYRPGQKYPTTIIRMLFAPQEELNEELKTLGMNLSKQKFVDPRLKALLAGKADQVDSLMKGL
jgi:superfamily II DNA or RNA helicase